jgi:hypothetical protein
MTVGSEISGAAKGKFIRNIVLKALAFFVLCNLMYAGLNPLEGLGRISAYNRLFPGRVRLPFGERPDLAYNLTLDSLEAMYAAHEIDGGEKPANEFRVIVLGDSSVWGYLLKPAETLTGQINLAHKKLADGRELRSYNLGYPTISLTKDLVLLQRAMQYQPDLIIWLMTLEAFPWEKQLASPLIQNNAGEVNALIEELGLPLETQPPKPTWQRNIVSQRRALADIFRLQVYGILWGATGIDQYYPEDYPPPQRDLEAESNYYGLEPPSFSTEELAFSLLTAGNDLANGIPLLVVNEPIFISDGENSEIRYNFFYPRWVYDQYRDELRQATSNQNIAYLDAWNLVAPGDFTNSAIHLSPSGSNQLADKVIEKIIQIIEPIETAP